MLKSLWSVLTIWAIIIITTLSYYARYLWLHYEAIYRDNHNIGWGPGGNDQRAEIQLMMPHLQHWAFGAAIATICCAILVVRSYSAKTK
ncbi:hypothetical protein [Alicyclobacillus fastidiosus]|uniref:Uncharacterized protein n=1 Tax=Alicyclobacillus fastidiosus TaxID=392011 RepID=A0ABV5AHY2_9BACL|nr:hypothetical protein [Alicyclobacillus fastidiosus]WEH08166.1 hypothetical protein PYS47_15785 [Alicyclobacillus fastidiosus]